MRRFLTGSVLVWLATTGAAQAVFVEAESFAELGGWKIDTATTLEVGSPYLLAHGLGQPVADAVTAIDVPADGRYRVWARTRDWVAPWGAAGTPGRFQLVVDGTALETELGTNGAEWAWQEAGSVALEAGEAELRLRDLTGFDGRCDAVYLSAERRARPPEARPSDGWPEEDLGPYDLVVVGGGYSGLGAAISAARQGVRVALVQDRFVLGGNGSSEVRVWANGGTMRGEFPHLGEIVEEFGDHAPDSPGLEEHFGDERKEALVRREETLDLFLGHFANGVEVEEGSGRILAVTALEVRTGRRKRFVATQFADCTGHGTIGALAGADFEIEPDGRMGMSNMWTWRNVDEPLAWPETPWALPLEMGDFPRTAGSRSRLGGEPFYKGEWFWESGFDVDPILHAERIRDWNLRAVFGAFSAMKRSGEHENAQLEWIAYVGGPRESRRLVGDVYLTAEDIVSKRDFPDGTVPTTWDIDLHYPKEQYAQKFPDNPFISRAEFGSGVSRDEGYPLPYRCFYSRNVPNLFMAGRCISVTHEALGTVRVMRTCGMIGEVVGKAAYLCRKHGVDPRGVYEQHLDELLALCREPGAMRRDTIEGPLYRDEGAMAVRPYRTKGDDDVDGLAPREGGIALAALPGIVVDDDHAVLDGSWSRGSLVPFVGKGYRYASPGAEATARFPFDIRRAGRYEIRVAWVGHENRGSRVSCVIERPGKPALRLRLDQRSDAREDAPFHSLGKFEFPKGAASVVLSAADSEGHVHADAIQVIEAS